ncbi:MAG: hypothetical protein LQ352_003567 [Teloschistes flavicans]|nr:MAG: hypothetical protein LQ352_003567 [Teloschistes flavicans]
MTTDDSTLIREVEDAQRYSYRDLSTSTSSDPIRLLEIQATNANGRVDAQLIELSIEDAKAHGYYALSYAWGQPLFTHRLYIDGYYLPITAHLHAALLSLYTLTNHRPSTYFWIDAICINQPDRDEKARQIPLMYSIFSNAEQVLIWLCGDDKLISEAFRQIPSTLESLREINSKKKQTYLEKNRELQACLDTRVGSARLTRLFEQDWFGRLWVVQEVAAADKQSFLIVISQHGLA